MWHDVHASHVAFHVQCAIHKVLLWYNGVFDTQRVFDASVELYGNVCWGEFILEDYGSEHHSPRSLPTYTVDLCYFVDHSISVES